MLENMDEMNKTSVVIDMEYVLNTPPELNMPQYNFSISENVHNESIVGSVIVNKPAGMTINALFSILYYNYYNQGGAFSVEINGVIAPAPIFNFSNGTTTLIVVNNSTLDREVQDTYTFQVTAANPNCPTFGVTTATVLITLTDENDNVPMIIEPPL